MTQSLITVEEMTFFIRFSRVCKKMDIVMDFEKMGDIIEEVARKSTTEDLLAMTEGSKEITGNSTELFVKTIVAELETRGAFKECGLI